MNSRKSKDRARLYDDNKNYSSSNKPYIYDISQNANNLQKDRKSLKPHNQNSESELKQNEAIFKNIEKCNQKMEYYKLMGSLEEQKRTMLEQENNMLKSQNEQLKSQLQSSHKQIRRLAKKLQKYGNELAKFQEMNSSKEENFIIELPNKHGKHKSRAKKSSPRNYQDQQNSNCQKCAYLEEQLMQERALYQKDRTYLKEQIQNLTQNFEDSQKQLKIVNKELSGISAFHDKKLGDIGQKFRSAQNDLKKQLTLCYRALQQKCDIIRQLQVKIDFFEQENHRIIKLLNIFDGTSSEVHHSLKKTLPFPIQKQERSKSTYNVKQKPPKHPNFFNSHEAQSEKDNSNIIDNRRKARKCGSIKKIQVD